MKFHEHSMEIDGLNVILIRIGEYCQLWLLKIGNVCVEGFFHVSLNL